METQKPAEAAPPEASSDASISFAPNPLAELVSHFEDDPDWDIMMDSIRHHRLEMDAQWASVE